MRACLLLCLVALAGCTTWGYKTRSGSSKWEPTRYEMVQVLFDQPDPATYEQIGFCSVLGGAGFITPDTDMLRKLQKAAADLGADAVILRKERESTGYGYYSYPQNSGLAIKWRDEARWIPPR